MFHIFNTIYTFSNYPLAFYHYYFLNFNVSKSSNFSKNQIDSKKKQNGYRGFGKKINAQNSDSNNNNSSDHGLKPSELPYFEQWQQVIINRIIQLNYYQKWAYLADKMDIYNKCNDSVRDALHIWYTRFQSNNTPIKDLKFISIPLPPKCKDLDKVFDFAKEKQRILDYIQKRNNDKKVEDKTLLTWTTIRHNLRIRNKYTLEVVTPLKIWYQEYYNEWMKKKKSEELSNSDSCMKNIQLVDLVIDLNEKNLGKLLVDVFTQIQQIFATHYSSKNDKNDNNYYTSFFDTFSSDIILASSYVQHGKIGLESIYQFHNVNNLTTFKIYLRSIPGLYPKLVLWAIEHPFTPENKNTLTAKHHVMPQFLINFGFNRQQIEMNYNLVTVSWIIHYLMHLIRFVEYGQIKDYQALRVMTTIKSNKSKENMPISLKQWNPLKSVAQTFTILFKNNWLQNYPQFEKDHKTFMNIITQKSIAKTMSSQLKNILTMDTVWRHVSEYGNKNQRFEFTHKAQNPENCTAIILTKQFIKAYNKKNELLNLPERFEFTENMISYVAKTIRQYINGGTKSHTTVYGFYLLNAKPPIQPLSKKYTNNMK